jgi:hypothetical protein
MIPNWPNISKIAITSALLLTLTGCAFFGKSTQPVTVMAKPVQKLPLNLAAPRPLAFVPLNWRVITPDNIDSVWAELRSQKQEPVLFALTPGGYQQLSLDVAEIRAFISNQRFIILRYQDYYEPRVDSESKNNKK